MLIIPIMLAMCILSFVVGYEFARDIWSWERDMINEWRDMYWKLWNKTK